MVLEQTLILLKHDSVQRSLVGQIISRFENAGLKVKLPTPRVAHSFAILRFAPEWGIWETKADTNRK